MAKTQVAPIKLVRVTVRMYRPGLGDCFLLTFHGKQGQADVKRHMLIDCGVLVGTDSGPARLGLIVKDIVNETRGNSTEGRLHTLVVTHEHADHLSGFGDHKHMFLKNKQHPDKNNFQIDNVWLGWTENKDDPKAQDIYSTARGLPKDVLKHTLDMLKRKIKERKTTYEKLQKEFKKELEAREGAFDKLQKELEKIDKLDQTAIENKKKEIEALNRETEKFLSEQGLQAIDDKDIKKTMRDIEELSKFLKDTGMQDVKEISRSHGDGPVYLKPDYEAPTHIWDDFGGVRFHVLGPPMDAALLKRSDPPKKTSGASGQHINQSTAFAMALMHGAAANEDLPDTEILSKSDVDELFGLCLPFDSSLGMPLDELQRQLEKPGAIDETANASSADPVLFFREHYGIGISLSDAPDWRRIDWDWMAPASSMALYLDGDINNTSLVLAIEIGEGGKVLLFPGDAQYGNWKSWVEKEGVKKLLSRTVFYKVGHHGSHNATLIDGGLSLMGTAAGFEDLVAMIPVDIQKAKSKEWEMPQSHLRDALIRQTKGRIILACEGMNPDEQCFSFDYQMPKEPPRPLKEPFGPLLKVKDKKWMDFRGAIKSDPKPDHLWVEYTLSL